MLERYINKTYETDLNSPETRARCRRVGLLIFLIVALSVGDLWVTYTFLSSFGMEEANPFAQFIIRQANPLALVLFKVGSVMGCVSLILLVRHRRQGEFAAWTAAAILIALTVRWAHYTSELAAFDESVMFQEAQRSDVWLTFANRRLQMEVLP